MSPLVIRTGKKAFYEIEGLDEPAAYEKAVPIMTENALFHDAQEGIDAFLRKRPPQWSGTDPGDRARTGTSNQMRACRIGIAASVRRFLEVAQV